MFKKIFVGGLLAILAIALIAGAVNRSLAKSSNESLTAAGNPRGNAQVQTGIAPLDSALNQALGQNHSDGGQGRSGGRGQGGGNGRGGQGGNQGYNGGQGGNGELGNLPAADLNDLSNEEAAALAFMREEEKLAYDVYTALYAQWGLNTFQNIAASEQAHMDAVKNLLDRYGLADPASAQAGIYTDPALQALYNELMARGSQSLSEAIKVGGAIEEVDILDLQERLAINNQADIQQVFNSLLRGSQNHLSAFANALQTQTGETYQPQYMSADQYQANQLAQGGQGRGGQGGNGGQGQGGKGQGGQGGNGYRGGRP